MGPSLKDVGKDVSEQVLGGTGMPDIHSRGHLAPLVSDLVISQSIFAFSNSQAKMCYSLKDVGKDGSKQVLDGTGMPDIHCRGHLAPLVSV